MGIWEALNSAADSIKSRLPDPSPITNAGQAAYGGGRDAVGTIDAAARMGATRTAELFGLAANKLRSGAPDLGPVSRRIIEAMPDRHDCVRIGISLADRALAEGTKPYIGPTYSIVKETLSKKRDPHERPKEREADRKKEEELQALRQRVETLEEALLMKPRMEEKTRSPPYPHHGSGATGAVAQKPEDVLRVFLMKGFKGGEFAETAWWLPQPGHTTKKSD